MPRCMALLFALVVGACSTAEIEVRVDKTPGVDWSAIRDYRWTEHKKIGDPKVDPTDLPEVLGAAVRDQLAARGFEEVEKQPDIELKHLFFFHRKTITRHMGSDLYGEGYYGEKTGRPPDEVYVEDLKYGTMVVEVFEPGMKKLLWRGRATAQIFTKDNPGRTRRRINEAVRMMFLNFPRAASAAK